MFGVFFQLQPLLTQPSSPPQTLFSAFSALSNLTCPISHSFWAPLSGKQLTNVVLKYTNGC